MTAQDNARKAAEEIVAEYERKWDRLLLGMPIQDFASIILKHFPSPPSSAGERDVRQQRVAGWCEAAFGAEQTTSLPQRGIRLLEEAIEAAQAAGCDPEMCHKLLDYVFSRPVGELKQELGGVQLCALALATAGNLSADECERDEVARVLAKPLEMFTARNQAKNAAGFHAAAAPTRAAMGEARKGLTEEEHVNVDAAREFLASKHMLYTRTIARSLLNIIDRLVAQ